MRAILPLEKTIPSTSLLLHKAKQLLALWNNADRLRKKFEVAVWRKEFGILKLFYFQPQALLRRVTRETQICAGSDFCGSQTDEGVDVM